MSRRLLCQPKPPQSIKIRWMVKLNPKYTLNKLNNAVVNSYSFSLKYLITALILVKYLSNGNQHYSHTAFQKQRCKSWCKWLQGNICITANIKSFRKIVSSTNNDLFEYQNSPYLVRGMNPPNSEMSPQFHYFEHKNEF